MAAANHLNRTSLMELLEELKIKTTTIDHPPVFTMEAMLPYLSEVEGLVAKNLFLKDKKKRLFLLSARHNAMVNLGEISEKVGAKGLRFADESVLEEKLGVTQGCVTALALVNDREKVVKFIADEELLSDKTSAVYFHPLDNAATTGLSPQDFLKFLEHTGHPPISVKFEDSA